MLSVTSLPNPGAAGCGVLGTVRAGMGQKANLSSSDLDLRLNSLSPSGQLDTCPQEALPGWSQQVTWPARQPRGLVHTPGLKSIVPSSGLRNVGVAPVAPASDQAQPVWPALGVLQNLPREPGGQRKLRREVGVWAAAWRGGWAVETTRSEVRVAWLPKFPSFQVVGKNLSRGEARLQC